MVDWGYRNTHGGRPPPGGTGSSDIVNEEYLDILALQGGEDVNVTRQSGGGFAAKLTSTGQSKVNRFLAPPKPSGGGQRDELGHIIPSGGANPGGPGDRLNHSQKLRHLLDALDELQTENERLKAEVDEHKTTKNGVPRGSSSVALRRSMSWGGR